NSEGSRVADPRALHAVVRGRVQGVGYRDFVYRHARALGLGGWVRNLPDGRSVEVFATGSRAVLDRLIEYLHDGPRLSYVTEVETDWPDAPAPAGPFEVRT